MKQESVHWSDCAVHNGPAYPAGPCDCGATQPWNEDEWRRNNWRCSHGWLRGEQCEICNAAQEPVAHLWECLGKWSAYLVTNGKQADCAPPSWLVEAIQNATTPPQRPWVGLTDEEIIKIHDAWTGKNIGFITGLVEAKLKEKNT